MTTLLPQPSRNVDKSGSKENESRTRRWRKLKTVTASGRGKAPRCFLIWGLREWRWTTAAAPSAVTVCYFMAENKIDYYLCLYRVVMMRRDPNTKGKAISLFFFCRETFLSKFARDTL